MKRTSCLNPGDRKMIRLMVGKLVSNFRLLDLVGAMPLPSGLSSPVDGMEALAAAFRATTMSLEKNLIKTSMACSSKERKSCVDSS